MLEKLFPTEQTLIKKLHAEVDNAEDRLLKEADEVLEKALEGTQIQTLSSLKEKAERLEKIGFGSAEAVQEYNRVKDQEEERYFKILRAKERAELIKYYKQNYPFQKFITEEELDRLCVKYNLIHAPVANYIKQVPEKNLKEIENAKQLDEKDDGGQLYNYIYKSGASAKEFKSFCNKLGGLPFTKHQIDEIKNKYGIGGHMEDLIYHLSPKLIKKTILSDLEEIDRRGLFIAAPEGHFNLKGISKKSKFGFFKTTIKKDPIVFRYVKGGIQVLTKWGLEAQDELLTNEINN